MLEQLSRELGKNLEMMAAGRLRYRRPTWQVLRCSVRVPVVCAHTY